MDKRIKSDIARFAGGVNGLIGLVVFLLAEVNFGANIAWILAGLAVLFFFLLWFFISKKMGWS